MHTRAHTQAPRRILALVIAAVLASGAVLLPTAATSASAAPADIDRILVDTNAARAEAGLAPLVLNPAVSAVAQKWAEKLATLGTLQHNPDYSTQIPAGWYMAAENVAANLRPDTVVNAWMNSDGHRRNILAAYTDIGIGYFADSEGQRWFVQNFAAYPAPTPTITGPEPQAVGAATVGSTLTAVVGTWSPSGVAFAYQWLRAGSAISGATAKTFKLTTADLGGRISVRVTAVRGSASVLKTSAPTAAVTGSFVSTNVPAVNGAPKVGSTLTAITGAWSPVATFGFQWFRKGVAISGATAKTYVVTSADVGSTLSVVVVGKRPNYVSLWKNSPITSPVTR